MLNFPKKGILQKEIIMHLNTHNGTKKYVLPKKSQTFQKGRLEIG